jgi:hypothetical protein
MSSFNCEPDDELYSDETADADEEYPREDNIKFLDELFAFYEKYASEDVEDALGS